MNALVEATPISGPACVYTVPSVSRVAMLPTTLQMARLDTAVPLGLTKGRQRVGGFARLGDDDGELVRLDDGIPVAIFGAVVDLDGNSRQRLDQEFADETRMPGRSARDDRDLPQSSKDILGEVDLLEKDVPLFERHPAQDGVSRGGRLLKDFFEHEVLVSAFFSRDRIPEHPLRGLGYRPSREVGELDSGRA